MAGLDLALHMPRDIADAVEIGHRSAAELHDQPGHGWGPTWWRSTRQPPISPRRGCMRAKPASTSTTGPTRRRRWPRAGETFDVILNMEVIEHVVDPAAFVGVCGRLLKPGGIMFVATINRTLKSFAFAIVGAEYVLGWLPRGTHHWEKLITPEELERWLAAAGLKQADITGVFYNPLTGAWARSRDADVNYMVVADKPKP
jgi:SAM-dependent methyltransferase